MFKSRIAELKETIESIKAELEEKPSQEEANDQEGDENKSFNFFYLQDFDSI